MFVLLMMMMVLTILTHKLTLEEYELKTRRNTLTNGDDAYPYIYEDDDA